MTTTATTMATTTAPTLIEQVVTSINHTEVKPLMRLEYLTVQYHMLFFSINYQIIFNSQATLQDWVAKRGREAENIIQQHVAAVKAKAPELQKLQQQLLNLTVDKHRIQIGM